VQHCLVVRVKLADAFDESADVLSLAQPTKYRQVPELQSIIPTIHSRARVIETHEVTVEPQ
jgi:hypothetical protein